MAIGTILALGSLAFQIISGMYKKTESPTYEKIELDNTSLQNYPVPVPYGLVRAAGNIIFKVSYSNVTQYVVAVGEGEISNIFNVNIDGNNLNNYVKDDAVPHKLADTGADDFGIKKSSWAKYLGGLNDDGSTPELSPLITDAEGNVLSPSARIAMVGSLKNTAYLSIFYRDPPDYRMQSATITYDIRGKIVEVYDGDAWVDEFSRNVSYIVRDLLTNARYGRGLAASRINDASFISSGDHADETVDGEARFQLDLMLDKQRPVGDVLDEMLSTCAGYFVESQGELKFKIDRAEGIIQSFDMDDIKNDSFSVNRTSIDDRPNRVIVEYTEQRNPNRIGTAKSEDEEDISANGLREQKLQLFGIRRFSQAARMARFYRMFAKLNVFRVQFGWKINAIQCEVGDVIGVTHRVMGWFNKPFRVWRIADEQSGDGVVNCVEYTAALYNDEGEMSEPGDSYSTLTDPNAAPPQITSFVVIKNFDEVSSYPLAVRRKMLQGVRNYYDGDVAGRNISPVILTDIVIEGSRVKRYDFRSVLLRESSSGVQIMGLSSVIVATNEDRRFYTLKIDNSDGLMTSSLIGQKMVIFGADGDNADGQVFVIRAMIDFTEPFKLVQVWDETGESGVPGEGAFVVTSNRDV